MVLEVFETGRLTPLIANIYFRLFTSHLANLRGLLTNRGI